MIGNGDVNNAMCYLKIKPITWSAVFSGAMIAFGLTFLFNLLTLGMGLAIVTANEEGIRNLAFNGFIWTLIGGVIILFIAGWKTGKLIKLHPYEVSYHETVQTVSSAPGHPSTTVSSAEVCTRTRGHCYHGMTHGFLAWVVYLAASLFFTIFITHAASVSGLNSSFLNIPLGIPKAIAESAESDNRNPAANNTSRGNARSTNTNTQTMIISPQTAEKAGEEIIGIFLIFALGAAASSIGSYLGLLCHRKCISSKTNVVP